MTSLRFAVLLWMVAAAASAQAPAMPGPLPQDDKPALDARCGALIQTVLLRATPESLSMPEPLLAAMPELYRRHLVRLARSIAPEPGEGDPVEAAVGAASARITAAESLYRDALLERGGAAAEGRLALRAGEAVDLVINRDLRACVASLSGDPQPPVE